jgi:hypothetical protein
MLGSSARQVIRNHLQLKMHVPHVQVGDMVRSLVKHVLIVVIYVRLVTIVLLVPDHNHYHVTQVIIVLSLAQLRVYNVQQITIVHHHHSHQLYVPHQVQVLLVVLPSVIVYVTLDI